MAVDVTCSLANSADESDLERVKPKAMQALFRLQSIQWSVLNPYPCHPAPPAALHGPPCCAGVYSAYPLALPPSHLLK